MNIKQFGIGFLMFLLLSVVALSQGNDLNQNQQVKEIENLFSRINEYSDTVQYAKCLDTIQQAIPSLRGDSLLNYYNLALSCYRGNYEKNRNNNKAALFHYQKYIDEISKHPNASLNPFTYDTYLWIGGLLKLEGHFAASIEAYLSAIPFADNPEWAKASTEKLIGDVYFAQNQYSASYKYYQSSATLFSSFLKKNKKDDRAAQRLVRCYEAIAEYHRLQNNLDSATYYLNLRRPLLKYMLPVALIDAYRIDGLVASELKEYTKAEEFYQKALDTAKVNFRTQKIAEIYHLRGAILLKQAKYSAAISDFDSALVNLKKREIILFKNDYAVILAQKAKALLLSQKNQESLQTVYNLLNNSLLLLDTIVVEATNDRDKQALFALQHEAFENAIYTAHQLFESTKNATFLYQAFRWSDKSRSAALRSALQLKNNSFAGVPDSIVQKENALRQKIAALENIMRLSNNDEEISQIALNLQKERSFQQKAMSEIAQKYPTYYQVQHQIKELNIEELQQSLPDNRTLIEYFITKNTVYIFTLNKKNGVFLHQSTISNEKLNDLLFETLDYVKGENDNTLTYEANASALYQVLLAPVQSQLTKELVVIPDGILCYLPFEVLLTDEKPSEQRLKNTVLENYAVSYHYAASLFQQKNTINLGKGVGVFIPNFQDDTLFYQHQQTEFLAKNISNATFFKDKEASKANFLKESSRFQTIHLSSHGYANDSIGDLSYLRLSNDERLYTSELYGININANLIVLSACETARGEIRGGESTIGLTLGFLYAGAKSVIGSLWNVNQNSTNHFITALYTQFKNHKSENTSANLQHAKLELIAQNPAYAHPKYWAAFVLVGNPDVEIALSTPFWQQPYFIFILFFVFLFFIKYYKSIFYKIFKKSL